MRLRDIPLSDVAAGRRWRLTPAEDLEAQPLQSARCEPAEAEDFGEEDVVVYSAVSVTDGGVVTPLLMIRRVGDLDYGGDYLEVRDGGWRQLGLEPDPDAEHAVEWVADPLEHDPSFQADDRDFRAEHRREFHRRVGEMDTAEMRADAGEGGPGEPVDGTTERETIVLRPAPTLWWINLVALLAIGGLLWMTIALELAWWMRAPFALILLAFPLAFADLATQKLVLEPTRLVVVEKLRRRVVERADIESVHWGKGEGAWLRLTDGSIFKLPGVGSSYQGLTNTVRAWLRRTSEGSAPKP